MSAPNPRVVFVLLALVGLCYTRGHYRQFIFDDITLIEHNEAIQKSDKLPGLLGLGSKKVPSHRVIRNLTYALEYRLWGNDARGYHFTNIFLHLLNTLLVMTLCTALLPAGPWAFIAALLWGVHPVHTECVTYLSGRRDVLSALFYLWSMVSYIRWRDAGGRGALLACAATYVLGCFTKEVAVTLPGVIAAYELHRLARENRGAGVGRLLRAVPGHVWSLLRRAPVFFAFGALFPLAFTLYILKFHPFNAGQWFITPCLPTDKGSVARYGAHYLWLLVFPRDLSMDYFPRSLTPSAGLTEPATLAACGLMGLLGALTVAALVRGSAAAFGGAWFFICFLPMSNLVIKVNEVVAEHYLYLPSVGFALALASGLACLTSRVSAARWPVLGAVAVAAGLLMIRTDARNREWEDPEIVYRSSLAVFPENSRLWNNLSCLYQTRGEDEQAMQAALKALSLSPDECIYNCNVALCLRNRGKLQEAQRFYERATRRCPTYVDALLGMAHNQMQLKDFHGALATYDRILALRGEEVWYAHHWRGIAYRELGDFARAREELGRAIERGGPHPEIFWQLALTARAQAKRATGDAAAAFKKESISLMEQALKIAPESAVLNGMLGDFHREDGRLDEALAGYEAMARANEDYVADAALRIARVHRDRNDRVRAKEAYARARLYGFSDRDLEAWLVGR